MQEFDSTRWTEIRVTLEASEVLFAFFVVGRPSLPEASPTSAVYSVVS
jgi:hypothetical protein